jgi:hypothetical protein
VDLDVPRPKEQPCRFDGSVSVLARGMLRTFPLTGGRWSIATAGLNKRGRMTGMIDAHVSAPDVQLTVRGTIDLPLLRVPVEFDW